MLKLLQVHQKHFMEDGLLVGLPGVSIKFEVGSWFE